MLGVLIIKSLLKDQMQSPVDQKIAYAFTVASSFERGLFQRFPFWCTSSQCEIGKKNQVYSFFSKL